MATGIAGGGPGIVFQHAEGIVVATAITGGGPGVVLQHAEGVVAPTAAAPR